LEEVRTSFRSHFLKNGIDREVDDDNVVDKMDSSDPEDGTEDESDSLDLDNDDNGNGNEALRRKLASVSDELYSEFEQSISYLESKQDEILLDTDAKMPILEFGADAERILQDASWYFDQEDIRELVTGKNDLDLIEETRLQILSRLAGTSGIMRLFETQLQSLREYYGRKYEAVLEQLDDDRNSSNGSGDNNGGPDGKELREKENKIMMEEAERFTEGFRMAGQNAIPLMCSEGGTLEGLVGYSFMPVLDGLIRDMMHATSSRKSIHDTWDDAHFMEDEEYDSDAGVVEGKKRTPAKWYQKLAARVFVFGVNYLQGWLALQGIRKAAADRDKLMPKFPLF